MRKISNTLEKPLAIYKPSQWINIGWFIIALVMIVIANINLSIVFIIVAIYKIIEVECWEYQIYDNHLCEKKGVFSITKEEVRMFRIKSLKIEEPFLMRLVGLSNVYMITSEEFKPNFSFIGVYNADHLKEYLSTATLNARKRNNVNELDLF